MDVPRGKTVARRWMIAGIVLSVFLLVEGVGVNYGVRQLKPAVLSVEFSMRWPETMKPRPNACASRIARSPADAARPAPGKLNPYDVRPIRQSKLTDGEI